MPDVNTPADLPDTPPAGLPMLVPAPAPADLDRPSTWADDLLSAALFLTRLPLTRLPWIARRARHDGLARALRAFPLIGALIGLAAGLVYALALLFGVPPLAGALLAVGATLFLTGALHEDGLADCADGFGAGRDVASRLAIMRDSRIGSYGTLALVVALGLRVATIADLDAASACLALVAAHAASRAAMPLLMALLEPARRDGLAAGLGRPSEMVLAQAVILGVLLCALMAGPFAGIVSLSVAALALAGLEALARRQIGGYTGDVLGAAQQVSEIAILLTLSAIW